MAEMKQVVVLIMVAVVAVVLLPLVGLAQRLLVEVEATVLRQAFQGLQ
jgi:hypothetical protein